MAGKRGSLTTDSTTHVDHYYPNDDDRGEADTALRSDPAFAAGQIVLCLKIVGLQSLRFCFWIF